VAAGWCLGPHHNALAPAHDAAVQMIDTSIVRVHQHGACITRNQRQSMGRSRGGLTSKIPYLYRARNRVERFFNRIKQRRRISTRYDRLAANYLAFVQLASIRLWLRLNESASWPSSS
jgi:transposase